MDWWGTLPSAAELERQFGLFQPADVAAADCCDPQVNGKGHVTCVCARCVAWKQYVRGELPGGPPWPQYEVFTEEHIRGLAAYIWGRFQPCSTMPSVKVLEATAYAGSMPTSTKAGESLSFCSHYEQALSEFQPDVVLVSWQPMGQDWTAAIRATPSVAEYILIGEIDDGICGQPWATWGHHPPGMCWGDSSSSSSSSGEIHGQNEAEANSTDGDATSPSISAGEKMQGMGTLGKRRRSAERDRRAPFEADNFVRQELCHLRALQLCRTDECWLSQRHSHTVSFRRQDQGRVDEEHWQSIPVQ
eukprot:jgi/Tetstr1/434839/TSEL_002554.t1